MTGVMDCSVAISLRVTRPLGLFEDGFLVMEILKIL